MEKSLGNTALAYIHNSVALVRERTMPTEGYETSRLPHLLDNWLTDGGDVISLMRRPPFIPRKILGTHFYQMLSRSHGHSAVERIRLTEKPSDLTENRTRDLSPGRIVPQPTTLSRTPLHLHIRGNTFKLLFLKICF
jgi:hypothetical protein